MANRKDVTKSSGKYERFFKRPLDLLLASVLIILLSWLFILLAILVAINMGFPILFIQERPGRIDKRLGKEKVFRLFKFRTMKNSQKGQLTDEARLTKFGLLLRKSSLDELPELFNILRGDMSFVGPRPLLVEYLPRYSNQQRARHLVRPGLTGKAQVNGRNSIPWEEKFKFDLEYINDITFLGDCKIILKTITKVLKKEGITEAGTQSMTEFTGNQ